MRPNPRMMLLFAPPRRTRTLLNLKSLNLKVTTPTIPTSLLREEEEMMPLTLTLTQMPPPRLVPLEALAEAGVAVAAAVEVITHPPLHLLYLLYLPQPLHLHQP
jgi:hypothetical protein